MLSLDSGTFLWSARSFMSRSCCLVSPTKVHLVEVLDEQVDADGMGTGVLPSGGKSCEQVTVVAADSHGSPITVLRMGVLDEHCDTVLDVFWEDEKTTSLTLA